MTDAAVTVYVAPARFVLTCLHRRDPAIPPVTAGPDPSDGMTVCGLPMLESELWHPVDGTEGDTLCTGCMPRAATPTHIEVEATATEALW